MTDIDYSKIKPGDVVGGVAQSVGQMGVWLETPGEEENRWVPFTAIVSHTPAPRPALKVGDRVRAPVTDAEWKIVRLDPPYVHFDVQPGGNSHFPTRLDAVETWERLS